MGEVYDSARYMREVYPLICELVPFLKPVGCEDCAPLDYAPPKPAHGGDIDLEEHDLKVDVVI